MAHYIFCEIAWMRYYNGITDFDIPRNGGKFIKENGEGCEVFNFSPFNHKCYGYVMHYGEEMHFERLDKKLKNSPILNDVTVVWVASNGDRSRIVGWYENAVMYRYWQYVPAGEKEHDYNFLAHEKDCYLIDEDQRSFIIPRAPKAGKGRGMGQSQVWYADSDYAQHELIPKVQAYLDSVRDKCKRFWLTKEELSKKAKDRGESTEELIEKANNKINFINKIPYLNLAVEKDDCYLTRYKRGRLFYSYDYLDEAEEDFKVALHFEENIDALYFLMCIQGDLNHLYIAIELGEKIHLRKTEDIEWYSTADILTSLYIDVGEISKAKKLMAECEAEENSEVHSEWIKRTRKYLRENHNIQ